METRCPEGADIVFVFPSAVEGISGVKDPNEDLAVRDKALDPAALMLQIQERMAVVQAAAGGPKNSPDNPNFAALKKQETLGRMFDIFFKRDLTKNVIESDIMKRIAYREALANMYVKDDSKSGFMSQMNEQRLRMLFTWLDRFWDEKKFELLRTNANIRYKDLLEMYAQRFKQRLRIERMVEFRKSELERTKPEPDVKPQSQIIREESLARLKIESTKDKIMDQHDARTKLAQYLAASIAMKPDLPKKPDIDLLPDVHDQFAKKKVNAIKKVS